LAVLANRNESQQRMEEGGDEQPQRDLHHPVAEKAVHEPRTELGCRRGKHQQAHRKDQSEDRAHRSEHRAEHRAEQGSGIVDISDRQPDRECNRSAEGRDVERQCCRKHEAGKQRQAEGNRQQTGAGGDISERTRLFGHGVVSSGIPQMLTELGRVLGAGLTASSNRVHPRDQLWQGRRPGAHADGASSLRIVELPVLLWFAASPSLGNSTRMRPTMRNILLPLKTMRFDEGGVEEIFSHIRNLLIATVVIAAGSYAIRQAPDVEIFGVLNLEIAGIGVGAIGFVLVGLNLIDGLIKLSKIGSSLALRMALVGLYLFFSMRLVQFVVLLRAG
jgi:hypothetical protein